MTVNYKENIIEAVIYPDRAFVTRKIEIDSEAGKNEVIFSNLPPHIIQDSINVMIEGSGNTKIEGVEVREELLEEIKNEDIKKLEEALIKYNDDLLVIESELNQINKSLLLLEKIKNLDCRDTIHKLYNNLITPDNLEKTLLLYNTNYDECCNDQINKIREKDKILQKIEVLTNEINDKKKIMYKKVLNTVVTLNIEKKSKFNIFLSYIVLNCGWTPIYDARVYFDENEIELSYYGEVYQMTGEDWDNIQIYLSTANPAVRASIPNLLPKYLTTANYNEGIATGSVSGFGIKAPIEKQAVIEKAGLNVNFKITNKDTVLSDGSRKKLLITKEKFSISFYYKSIPKQVENVFVNSKIKNTCEYPLLSGTVRIFHGIDYIGDSFTKTIVPNEEMELSLGIDDSFKVKRERINKYRKTKGLTGNYDKYEYTYRIVIENFKKTDRIVTVMEPVPISKNNEIKCRLESSTDNMDPNELGIMTWEKNIKANDKMELNYKFNVEYPKNKALVGLE